MAATPLTNIAPAQHREKIYWVYAIVGVIIGAIQVGYAAADSPSPEAVDIAFAVYAYLGIALGATAGSNVNPMPISSKDERPATRPAGDPPGGV